MQKDPTPASRGRESFAQKSHGTIKCRAVKISVRCSPATQREEFVGIPFLARHFRDDLLSQHIHRRDGNGNHVEMPLSDRPDHRHAFNQFVASQREQPAFRGQTECVARTTNPLKKRGNITRRTNLQHEIDVADVDAHFERRRGNHGF